MLVRWLWLALLLVVWWVVRKALRRPAGPIPGPFRRPGSPSPQGEMVRDRVCNTYLPRDTAIELRRGGETHFFCSEACRSKFLAGPDAAAR